ncbi:lysophospholipase precursor [Cordyceps fumosorosea ARSEF 2679]|uniref:Lysophospholipase n=1 Tax=Cordyceps fumosorosea (strain ARSEF 2679) TaxID=1081104 RepID=A0A168ARH5_CORFA|nr:lysophospholipase precursor [Cordyceps fumosorosea ARSEF 2679]OAA69096.1 lysophospholipase precursor [Cordyceps fumosorosea ARSEF 2679]
MRQPQILVAAALALACPSIAGVAETNALALRNADLTPEDIEFLIRRATAQAPDGYAPSEVTCPSTRPFIRDSSSTVLSPEETAWLPMRRNETITHIKDFLKRAAIPNFDSDAYLQNVNSNSSALPNIGIAISGGGYRAMLNGAGAIKAFDSRSTGSTDKGNLGGLLQSATYLSGLSGGGWLVGSIFTNNFTTVQDAVATNKIWEFGESILEGPKDIGIVKYYATILDELDNKHDAGFNRSITDIWGRMLSFQLVNAKNGGPSFTFSSIANDTEFAAGRTPLPILVADSRAPGEKNTTIESVLFEFNPWELGSTDPGMTGFVPLKYTGSKFDNGTLPSSEKCINGFDNVGYVMGTSSSLFNQIILRMESNPDKYQPKNIPKTVIAFITDFLTTLGNRSDDVADWTPNPFKNWNSGKNYVATSDSLTLVDGGEDGQNVPFHPHTVDARKVDVVFAVDSSADTSNWPDGAAPFATYQRTKSNSSAGTSFPVVPDNNTFINLGLNTRPTFFGCDVSSSSGPIPPLVVYMANYPYVFHSNLSTFTMSINDTTRDAVISNGWAVVTQMNSTRDTNWPTCVSCAMLSRSFDRTKTTVPAACKDCFSKYCWNGTVDSSKPAASYAPQLWSNTTIDVASKKDSGGARTFSGSATLAVAAVAMGVMFFI